jgi:hypothetical protein
MDRKFGIKEMEIKMHDIEMVIAYSSYYQNIKHSLFQKGEDAVIHISFEYRI